MADHRKRPLLRDPISGKRPRRRLLLLSALIVVGGLGVLTSAEAQEGSLSGGAATFAAGKFDATVRQMTGVPARRQRAPGRRRQGALSPRPRLSKARAARPAPSPISARRSGLGCRRPSAPWLWSTAASPTRPRASRLRPTPSLPRRARPAAAARSRSCSRATEAPVATPVPSTHPSPRKSAPRAGGRARLPLPRKMLRCRQRRRRATPRRQILAPGPPRKEKRRQALLLRAAIASPAGGDR